MYNMDQFNLLDLDNDVLNIIGDIIGDYVKKDNNIREFNELIKKEIFNEADKLFKRSNKRYQCPDDKPSQRRVIINYFYVNGIEDMIIIDEYLTLKKLNLKNKKYSFDYIQNRKDKILDFLNKYIYNANTSIHSLSFNY